jgi:hypothetical protein
LANELRDKVDVGRPSQRYDDSILDLFNKINCHILGPLELEQFLYDVSSRVEGAKIVLETDESDVSAFLKLMVDKGAKVEIFSAHDYPEAEYGRGK